jgi:hypothetical protein
MMGTGVGEQARTAVDVICILLESDRDSKIIDDGLFDEATDVGYRLAYLIEVDEAATASLLDRAVHIIRDLRSALGPCAR